VAPVDKLSVVFAILFAVVLLREKLGWQQWIGGACVVVGAVILATK
jgi:transporter family protein